MADDRGLYRCDCGETFRIDDALAPKLPDTIGSACGGYARRVHPASPRPSGETPAPCKPHGLVNCQSLACRAGETPAPPVPVGEVADAAKFIELLAGPCSPGHKWTRCPRCLAIAELNQRDPLGQRLLSVAAAALRSSSPPETPAPPVPVGSVMTLVDEHFLSEPCAYGDECPDHGTRHGRCLPCKFKRAAAEDAARRSPSPEETGTRNGERLAKALARIADGAVKLYSIDRAILREAADALRAPSPQPETALIEWGDAVAAIAGCPGPPPAEAIDRLIAAGDALAGKDA
jgi:hypothetical protein